jgi:anti-anti-sigma regulatory factor
MLTLHTERFVEVAVIQCQGRIVQDDAAFKLRDAVRQQRSARAILLDFSEVQALEGGGLGMLLFLQQWTRDRGIRFQVFDPPRRVRQALERVRSTAVIEIAGMSDVLSLIGWNEKQADGGRAMLHDLFGQAA